MAKMYTEALRDLTDAGCRWTFNTKRLHSGGGGAYELATARGKQWLKIHSRGHDARHRYWVGINFEAVAQVDSLAFWFKGEEHLYVVPVQFFRDILEKVPRGFVTVREGQWHVDIYADTDELALPNWRLRYKLSDHIIRIPKSAV